jgi:ankyrin repeat protein
MKIIEGISVAAFALAAFLPTGMYSQTRNELGEKLIEAATSGDVSLVQRLLQQGVDIGFINANGDTALTVAAQYDDAELAGLLLAKGAAIDAPNGDGQTPLFLAGWEGNNDMVAFLLDRGANIEAKSDPAGLYWSLLSMFGKGKVANYNGSTALIGAAANNQISTVRLLLDRKADIEASDNIGHTALVAAADLDNEVVVKLLLDRGADIEAKDKYGRTALWMAVEDTSYDVFRLLMDRGADIDVHNDIGFPLGPFAFQVEMGWAEALGKSPGDDYVQKMLSEAKEITRLTGGGLPQLPQAVPVKPFTPEEIFWSDVRWLGKYPNDRELRAKIITRAQQFIPPPEIPQEAHKALDKGAVLFRKAKDPSDFELSISSFKDAIRIAPWWPEAYYNLGLALGRAEKFDEAVEAMNLYLVSNPNESGAKGARQQLLEFEAGKELAQAKKVAAAAKEAEKERAIRSLFQGRWLHEYEDPSGNPGRSVLTFRLRGSTVEYISGTVDAKEAPIPEPWWVTLGTISGGTLTLELDYAEGIECKVDVENSSFSFVDNRGLKHTYSKI